jgi:hypothetical protein
MEQMAKKIEEVVYSSIPKLGTPIKVKQATLQSETHWPGKLGAEISINPVKYPKIKMTWIDGRGLTLEWEDGSFYTIPQAAVKGFEHL